MRPAALLPNALTILRLVMAAPLAIYLWQGRITAALVLLVIAGITDLADGAIAREFNLRTTLGSWLDPAADKTMITTVLVTLTLRGDVPRWFCAVTIARDLALAGGALYLVVRGAQVKIRPLLSGKAATVAQNLALVVSIVKSAWAIPAAGNAIYWASAALTIFSFGVYSGVFAGHLKRLHQAPGR